jgi:hypothetical protein
MILLLLHRMSPLVAHRGHAGHRVPRQLSGAKRTRQRVTEVVSGVGIEPTTSRV